MEEDGKRKVRKIENEMREKEKKVKLFWLGKI